MNREREDSRRRASSKPRSELILALADRCRSPLIQLLILDWRFTFAVVAICAAAVFGLTIDLKVWKRTPAGFLPEIRISTLDFLQARSLRRTALAEERRGEDGHAIHSWRLAMANDPGDLEIGIACVRALLRSKDRADLSRALELAGWLCALHPGPLTQEWLLAAADRNEAWNVILAVDREGGQLGALSASSWLAIARALFRTGAYPGAKAFLAGLPRGQKTPELERYERALDCILSPSDESRPCEALRQSAAAGAPGIETLELYALACAEKSDLAGFRNGLEKLAEAGHDSLNLQIVHSRLLRRLGRLSEAREVASRFPAPASGLETSWIAEELLALGQQAEALALLHEFCGKFADSSRHWIIYARLLLRNGEKSGLRWLKGRIDDARLVSPVSNAIAAAIDAYLHADDRHFEAVRTAVNMLTRFPADAAIWFFVVDALVLSGRPDLAAESLLVMKPSRARDFAYHAKLFEAAEAARDAELMREAAEACFRLAPRDRTSIGNYAAMLTMFDEQPEKALSLSAACLELDPGNLSARVNHAAALVNAGHIAQADLILREIDERVLTRPQMNQLNFIKLKRALRIADREEASRLAPLLDRGILYSRQLSWLRQHGYGPVESRLAASRSSDF